MSKYMKFTDVSDKFPKRKTKTTIVTAKSNMWPLGVIKWDSGWRQYVFEPVEECPSKFSRGCLRDIDTFIEELMEVRK